MINIMPFTKSCLHSDCNCSNCQYMCGIVQYHSLGSTWQPTYNHCAVYSKQIHLFLWRFDLNSCSYNVRVRSVFSLSLLHIICSRSNNQCWFSSWMAPSVTSRFGFISDRFTKVKRRKYSLNRTWSFKIKKFFYFK